MNADEHQFPTRPTVHVGDCRSCGNGPLGVRVCGECGALVLVCDECDSAWADADIDQPAATTGTTTLPCPHCGSDLYEPPARWASSEELEACQWLSEAIVDGALSLHGQGDPLDEPPAEEL